MIGHFRCSATAARYGRKVLRAVDAPPSPQEDGATRAVGRLLRAATGRPLTLLVGGRLVTGRLLAANPILLSVTGGGLFACGCEDVTSIGYESDPT